MPALALAALLTLAGCAGEGDAGERAPASPHSVTPPADRPPDGTPGASAPENGVHPSFGMTLQEFTAAIEDLPGPDRAAAAARPREFLGLLAEVAREPAELSWLVDKAHALAADYAPDDLIELDGYGGLLDLSRAGHRLRAIALEPLTRMVADARQEGITLLVSSAYRSYDYQAELYEYWVSELGQEEADRTSARPGTSQHQLGTVIDFGCICEEFADTEAGAWLAENAWRYGYSLSYPDGYESLTGYAYESWHFRFIGAAGARMTREFFGGIQQRFAEFMHGKSAVFLSYFIEI